MMSDAAGRRAGGQPHPGMTVDFSRLRFLIVDDNAFMRRLVRTLLTGFGAHNVEDANDGAAGLDAIRHTRPDIVIVDWEMPVVDGIELTRKIRQLPPEANPFLPIIMMTGHADKKRVLAARDAGVNEFVVKPISASALYSRVLSIVAKPRAFVRTKQFFGPDRRRNLRMPHRGPERRKAAAAFRKAATETS